MVSDQRHDDSAGGARDVINLDLAQSIEFCNCSIAGQPDSMTRFAEVTMANGDKYEFYNEGAEALERLVTHSALVVYTS